MRRKWDSGLKALLAGLNDHVEAGHVTAPPS
jgi:hypothetical protein